MTMPRDTPDHLLRESLRTWENLRDLLASALPAVIENFDFTGMQEVPREFFTGDWREREADLIFEVGYRVGQQTTPSLVGVLVEHQTDTEQWIPFRALHLLVNYWERRYHQWQQTARREATFRLPPVFCVVLYTGATTWGSNTNVRQLLDEPAELHQYAPDWGPQFWNLAARSADDLLGGPPWMWLMAVVRAEREARAEYERVLEAARRRLDPLEETAKARWSQLMRAVYSYSLFRRPGSEHARIREIMEGGPPARVEEVRAMEKTIAQVIEERAEERGEARGKIAAARRALLQLVRSRLGGQCPEQLAQQIEASTDLKELEGGFDRALAAADLTGFRLRE
jgi:hypothetical protein